MENFDLLYEVLSDLHRADILRHCVLIGSWCQDFYRHQFGNPFQIPAAKTTDADMLLPKQLKFKPRVDIAAILEKNGFKVDFDLTTGLSKFIHEEFKFEFLTDAGAKHEETVHKFKNLNVSAQELHFMSIPQSYNYLMPYKDIAIRLVEPEAFALHKLIVSERRRKAAKREKDVAAARGLLEYFEGKPQHIKRLHTIYGELPKGWQKKIDAALAVNGLTLPQ